MIATFGAGCFWGVEEAFRTMEGVLDTEVGFEGGAVENPTYEEVCNDNTGHAEVVQLKFDPKKVSYSGLLKKFWEIHDPTQVNRQGADVGDQYRSVIFYHSDDQKKEAEQSQKDLAGSGKYSGEIATQIESAQKFCRAEDYHQKYLMKKDLKTCAH